MKSFLKIGSSTCLAVMLSLSTHAAMIPTDLQITASSSFDDSALGSFPIFNGTQTGSFATIIGGAMTPSTVDDVTVTGANPQSGVLTDTGDGVMLSANVDGDAGSDALGFFFDFSFDLVNNSLTEEFTIILDIIFDNATSISSADAYVDSEINVFDSVLSEIWATDLTTDSLAGDQKNGVDPGTFGASQTDSGTVSLPAYVLAAGTSDSLSGFIKIDGAEFDGLGGFSAASNFKLLVSSVTSNVVPPPPPPPVSEPLSVLLLMTGLIGMVARKRLIKKQ